MNLRLATVALATSWLVAGCFGDAPFATPEGEVECTDFPAVRVRRLTRTEFNASAGAALGFGVTEGSTLAAEDRSLGFTNHDKLEVSPLFADQLEQVSLQLATKAAAQVEKLAPCAAGTPEADCARNFINAFVPKAYRRPITDQERTGLLALFAVGRDGTDYATAVQTVVQAVLESSSFLYRTELGSGTGGGVKALTADELASQLSYMLTAGPPDAELKAAAEAGSLASADEREKHARRLLESAASRAQLKEFVTQWLGASNIGALVKNNNTFPDFSTALRDSMKAENERFVEHVLSQDKARLTELLTANYTFADSSLAQFYGLPDRPGTTPAKVALPETRAGILTQAGLLALYGHPDDSSPILRGKLIRTRLLCGTIPPPPPTVVAAAPPPDGTKTTRKRVEAHTSNASCSGCHSLLDPIGFGMEDFDGLGKYRTTENGIAIDASGELTGTRDPAHEGAFTGAAALARMLAANSDVSDCVTNQLFRFGMGRQEQPLDSCTLIPALSRFRGNELDLRELMVAYVRSAGFATRRSNP